MIFFYNTSIYANVLEINGILNGIKFDIVCGDVYNKTITAMTERVDD